MSSEIKRLTAHHKQPLYKFLRWCYRKASHNSSNTLSMSATFNPLLIVQHLSEGEVTIDKLANKLNIPRRILQRRLSDRDTNFLNILQEVRFKVALRYLPDSRLSITEIAFSLGYADQGSFSSAFKSWHRVSPRDYRRK